MSLKDTFRDEREAYVSKSNDASRPFKVIKPKGYLHRVLNYYTTEKAAKRAARRWNNLNC